MNSAQDWYMPTTSEMNRDTSTGRDLNPIYFADGK